MDFIWGNLSLAIGAMLLSIFVGWVWGIGKASEELSEGSAVGSRFVAVWGTFLRWICPLLILLVLITLFPAGARLLALVGLS